MAERLEVAVMFKEKTSTVHLIETAEVPSSTWYDQKNKATEDKRFLNKGRPRTQFSTNSSGEKISNEAIVKEIQAMRTEPFFQNGGGYKKMSKYIQRRLGAIINKKKIYRLMKENNLLLSHRKRIPKGITRRLCQNHIIDGPFQLWELDIKYGYLVQEKKYFYIMAIIDVYLRYVVGYHVGLRCLGSDLSRTLNLALKNMNIKDQSGLYIRSDNGPQMKSKNFMESIKNNERKLVQEFIPCGMPNKNAHIESFNSIVEVEYFCVSILETYRDAYRETNRFINFYHNERIHGSLKNQTPQECLEIIKSGGVLDLKNIKL